MYIGGWLHVCDVYGRLTALMCCISAVVCTYVLYIGGWLHICDVYRRLTSHMCCISAVDCTYVPYIGGWLHLCAVYRRLTAHMCCISAVDCTYVLYIGGWLHVCAVYRRLTAHMCCISAVDCTYVLYIHPTYDSRPDTELCNFPSACTFVTMEVWEILFACSVWRFAVNCRRFEYYCVRRYLSSLHTFIYPKFRKVCTLSLYTIDIIWLPTDSYTNFGSEISKNDGDHIRSPLLANK
jgi:hypothetical protein